MEPFAESHAWPILRLAAGEISQNSKGLKWRAWTSPKAWRWWVEWLSRLWDIPTNMSYWPPWLEIICVVGTALTWWLSPGVRPSVVTAGVKVLSWCQILGTGCEFVPERKQSYHQSDLLYSHQYKFLSQQPPATTFLYWHHQAWPAWQPRNVLVWH